MQLAACRLLNRAAYNFKVLALGVQMAEMELLFHNFLRVPECFATSVRVLVEASECELFGGEE